MSKLLLIVVIAFLTGCGTVQATRKADFVSDAYSSEAQKNILVISLIDARPDKQKDMQEFMSNKNVLPEFVFNPLKRKGYAPKLLRIDTSTCGSLVEVKGVEELPCLDQAVLEKGDLFMLISIDAFTPPQKAAGVVGVTRLTGAIYSKSSNSFIWKDSHDGANGGTGLMYGLGGYAGMLILKAMNDDYIFRNNVMTSITVLFDSLPPIETKKKRFNP